MNNIKAGKMLEFHDISKYIKIKKYKVTRICPARQCRIFSKLGGNKNFGYNLLKYLSSDAK